MFEYKGYAVAEGYMGHIGGNQYRLFASESDYKDWFLDEMQYWVHSSGE